MSRSHTTTTEAATATGAGVAELPQLAGMDLSAACKVMGGSHALLLRAAQAFLRDYMAVPRTMAACHQASDYAEVGRIAHTIKGAASYLCAQGLTASAAALEKAADAADGRALTALIPTFISDMTLVLDGLSRLVAARSEAPAQDTMPSEARRNAALALTSRITPLLENGEYAAIPLLEQLAEALRGGPLANETTAIIDRFEELDIDDAAKLLASLTQRLRVSPF